MVLIYCIEDINDLKYIGSTTQKLNARLSGHKTDKLRGQGCSSNQLNLYECIIYTLEECEEDLRKERERYWINEIDCVNLKKFNGVDKEKKKEYDKQYIEKHKEERSKYRKEYYCKFNK